MEPKKHKKKNSYTVMVISDSSKGVIRQFFFSSRVVTALLSFFLAVVLVFACYVVYSTYTMREMKQRNLYLDSKTAELSEKNAELTTANTELSDKVSILSSTINQKVEEEAAVAEKYVPTGFPLAGTATIPEEAEDKLNDNPIVNFAASAGTSVIATGNGVISSIDADAEYGYVLKLDHGNGYVTIYRNASEPKVKAGDEVARNTMLFEMTEESGQLGYQIIKDDQYIDPLEIIEING